MWRSLRHLGACDDMGALFAPAPWPRHGNVLAVSRRKCDLRLHRGVYGNSGTGVDSPDAQMIDAGRFMYRVLEPGCASVALPMVALPKNGDA